MNDNLSQMVKDTTPEEPTVFSEVNLDLPDEEVLETTEEIVEETTEVASQNTITITELAPWFEAHSESLDNINQVKVSIRGVDSNKTLIMAVKDGDEQDAAGNDKRALRVFDNADVTPVLNLPPATMNVYNNGFRIIHQYSDTIYIKSYGVKAGLICTLCILVNGKLIPYTIQRIRRKDTELEVPPPPESSALEQKLAAQANIESLQLLYKQSAKTVESFTTNQSVVDWLVNRQETVTDINHHLQIDNVMIELLK